MGNSSDCSDSCGPHANAGGRSRSLIVLHAVAEKGTAQIVDAVGYDPSAVLKVLHRFRPEGEDGLRDHREDNGHAKVYEGLRAGVATHSSRLVRKSFPATVPLPDHHPLIVRYRALNLILTGGCSRNVRAPRGSMSAGISVGWAYAEEIARVVGSGEQCDPEVLRRAESAW